MKDGYNKPFIIIPVTENSSPDRPNEPPSSEEQRVNEFLDLAEKWLQEGLRKISEAGVPLRQEVKIFYEERLLGHILGGFKSVVQLRQEILEFAQSKAHEWLIILQHWQIKVDPKALQQIIDLQLLRHPLQPLIENENESSIFVTLHASTLATSTLRIPASWPSLNTALLRALWSVVEHKHGFQKPMEIKDGTERWVADHLLGGSTEPAGASDDSLFGLQHRVSARLVGEILATEPQPLQALLKPEIRAEIARRYEQEITPRVDQIHREYFSEELTSQQGFSWMKEPAFRNFRHEPTLATFCEGLRTLGYDLLAQDLEQQPEAAEKMISGLGPAVEQYMQQYRYTDAEVKEHLQRIEAALAQQHVRPIETSYMAGSMFLMVIFDELGIARAGSDVKFAAIAPEAVPADLQVLFEKTVQAEKRLAQDPIEDISLRSHLALQEMLDEPEAVELGLEQIVETMLDYWNDVQAGRLEDARSLKEGFAGEPYEISVENVNRRREEIKAAQEPFEGDKEAYLQRLEALLIHLMKPEGVPRETSEQKYDELEQAIRILLLFWDHFISGRKEDAQKLRETSVGTPHEISLENVRNRLEELKDSQQMFVGDKADYLHRVERLLGYLELEGTEGFY